MPSDSHIPKIRTYQQFKAYLDSIHTAQEHLDLMEHLQQNLVQLQAKVDTDTHFQRPQQETMGCFYALRATENNLQRTRERYEEIVGDNTLTGFLLREIHEDVDPEEMAEWVERAKGAHRRWLLGQDQGEDYE